MHEHVCQTNFRLFPSFPNVNHRESPILGITEVRQDVVVCLCPFDCSHTIQPTALKLCHNIPHVFYFQIFEKLFFPE